MEDKKAKDTLSTGKNAFGDPASKGVFLSAQVAPRTVFAPLPWKRKRKEGEYGRKA